MIYFRLYSSVSCSGHVLTLIKKRHTLNFYSFLQKFFLKTKTHKLVVGNFVAQFTAKTRNSEKGISRLFVTYVLYFPNRGCLLWKPTASLAKWLCVHLQTKRLLVWVPLQSRKLQISRLFQATSSLTFKSNLESEFTLKRVYGLRKTCS